MISARRLIHIEDCSAAIKSDRLQAANQPVPVRFRRMSRQRRRFVIRPAALSLRSVNQRATPSDANQCAACADNDISARKISSADGGGWILSQRAHILITFVSFQSSAKKKTSALF